MGRLKNSQLSELKGLKDSFDNSDNINSIDSRILESYNGTKNYSRHYDLQKNLRTQLGYSQDDIDDNDSLVLA